MQARATANSSGARGMMHLAVARPSCSTAAAGVRSAVAHVPRTRTMLLPLRPSRGPLKLRMGRRSDKIAMRKGKADAKKAKLYARMGKKIVQCAKSGGADPTSNSKLAEIVNQAKSLGVPKDIIERNLKKASDQKQADYSELCYEAYGPGGTGFIVECLTDNVNRTASDVKSALNKLGCKVAEPGSVMFQFERKGLVVVDSGDEDAVLEAAMDAGAEDLEAVATEDGKAAVAFKVFTAASAFASCMAGMQAAGLALNQEDTQLVYKPAAAVEVDDDAFSKCEAVVDRLLELDDVDAVYTNCDGLVV